MPDETIKVDVEEPGRDPWTIPLEQAIEEYYLDLEDVEKIKSGEIYWFRGDTAISLHEEEE